MSAALHDSVDRELLQFAESLKANEQYSEEGRQLLNKVGCKLQERSKYSIAKRLVGGSVGKNTDVIAPDFDLVLVVNDHEPPFEDVLDDFHNILLLNEHNLSIDPNSLEKVGRSSVQFRFTNGIEVDLLVGANLSLEAARSRMLAKPGDAMLYSTTLVEQAQEFMRRQDSFTHSLVRLAKFWFKSLHFGGGKVSGGSAIIEQVCVAAALKEDVMMGKKSLVRAFTSVIEMFEKLDKLKLAFEKDGRGGGNWKQIPVQTLNSGNVRFGDWGYCNKDTLDKRCYIIEAINPLNNLLAGLKLEKIEKFKTFAGVTRKRLSDLMADKLTILVDGGSRCLLFDKLFESQPANLKEEFPSGIPGDMYLSYSDPWTSPYYDLKVRREAPMARLEVKSVVHALKYNLLWTVHCATARGGGGPGQGSSRRATTTTVADNVRSSVKTLVETNLQVNLGPAGSRSHEGFDVTLSVPYFLDGSWHATRLSMNWS